MITLKEINKQIEEAEKQSADLKSQLEEQKSRLAEARAEQKNLILNSKGTDKIESEIISLQTKLQGTQAAIESVNIELQDMQQKKKRELNNIQLIQVEQTSDEAMTAAIDAYITFCELVGKTEILKSKSSELRLSLKPLLVEVKSRVEPELMESQSIVREPFGHRLQRLNRLWQNLEKYLFLLLQDFPTESFTDKSLPTIEQLRQKLKDKSLR